MAREKVRGERRMTKYQDPKISHLARKPLPGITRTGPFATNFRWLTIFGATRGTIESLKGLGEHGSHKNRGKTA
jgi:hypothetical protein